MRFSFTSFVRDERGSVAIEYALLICCGALLIIVAAQHFGVSVSGMLDKAAAGFGPGS